MLVGEREPFLPLTIGGKHVSGRAPRPRDSGVDPQTARGRRLPLPSNGSPSLPCRVVVYTCAQWLSNGILGKPRATLVSTEFDSLTPFSCSKTNGPSRCRTIPAKSSGGSRLEWTDSLESWQSCTRGGATTAESSRPGQPLQENNCSTWRTS